ncbi:unnamed protein product, partial [Rotaria sordida]
MSNRSGIEVFVYTIIVVSDDDFFTLVFSAVVGRGEGEGVEVGPFPSSSAGDNNSLSSLRSRGVSTCLGTDSFNFDDIYPTVKVTCDGELPENATESENKDN